MDSRCLRRVFQQDDFNVFVIVGIREQVDLLTSLYVQHVHMGGVLDGQGFIEHCNQYELLKNFNFFRYFNKIDEIFGADHLYVMIYESFRSHFSEELLRLLNFMGEPEIPEYKDETRWRNKSMGALQLSIARRLNRLFQSPRNPEGCLPIVELPVLGPLQPRRLLQNKVSFALHYKKYEFPADLQDTLKKQYAESNHQLAEAYGLALPASYLQ